MSHTMLKSLYIGSVSELLNSLFAYPLLAYTHYQLHSFHVINSMALCFFSLAPLSFLYGNNWLLFLFQGGVVYTISKSGCGPVSTIFTFSFFPSTTIFIITPSFQWPYLNNVHMGFSATNRKYWWKITGLFFVLGRCCWCLWRTCLQRCKLITYVFNDCLLLCFLTHLLIENCIWFCSVELLKSS